MLPKHLTSLLAILGGGLLYLHLSLTVLMHRLVDYVNPDVPVNSSSFDFIVVGSGSAGSVVTARLVQGGFNVLLLEAGGPSHWLQGVPGMTLAFLGSPYDWSLTTQPQEACGHAYHNNSLFYPRGKSLGGSSVLNHFMHVMGQPEDYDHWLTAGNEGWGYEELKPYFERSMKGSTYPEEVGHNVESLKEAYEVDNTVYEAAKELGLKLADINAQPQLSEHGAMLYPPQYTITDGWRLGTYRSFVEPLLSSEEFSSRLTVLTHAQVTKILMDEREKRALGVQVHRFGQTLNFYVSKEVILSAGAIHSPQLLMLSGIGPQEELKAFNIPVIQDLEVGRNLQDHVLVPLGFYFEDVNEESRLANVLNFVNPLRHLQFLLFNSGPLAKHNVMPTATVATEANTTRPDVQMLGLAASLAADNGLGALNIFGFRSEAFEAYWGAHVEHAAFFWSPVLLRPKSRGHVKLSSTSIWDAPLIDPRFLTHEEDVNTLIRGMRYIHDEMARTKAFEKIKPFERDQLHCGEFKELSDEYFECFVRAWAATTHHAVGTCRMGLDQDGVVDNRLRVRGIKDLRVIDASIMPHIVSGNTHVTSVVIGERGAAFVLDHHHDHPDHTKTHEHHHDEL